MGITESCLILGTPVTDVMTSANWLALVRVVADMADRLSALEQ